MAYDQETLNILKGLQTAQPTTQQVDYSGFMNDFQPVQNYPNYFVPQQGLLQNIRHIVRFRCYATKTTTFVKYD